MGNSKTKDIQKETSARQRVNLPPRDVPQAVSCRPPPFNPSYTSPFQPSAPTVNVWDKPPASNRLYPSLEESRVGCTCHALCVPREESILVGEARDTRHQPSKYTAPREEKEEKEADCLKSVRNPPKHAVAREEREEKQDDCLSLEFLLDLYGRNSSDIVGVLMKKEDAFTNTVKSGISSSWIHIVMRILCKIRFAPETKGLIRKVCCSEFLSVVESHVSTLSTSEHSEDHITDFVTDLTAFLECARQYADDSLVKSIIMKTLLTSLALPQFKSSQVDHVLKEKVKMLEASLMNKDNADLKNDGATTNVLVSGTKSDSRMLSCSFPVKPAIADLVRSMFLDVNVREDHSLPREITGVQNDILFVNTEQPVENVISLTISFCQYLMRQKYEKQDIAIWTVNETMRAPILSMLNQQEETKRIYVRTVLHKGKKTQSRIVLLLLNFTGFQSGQGILGKVENFFNAFCGAQEVLYMFGNIAELEKHHAAWGRMKKYLQKRECVRSYLPLQCSLHMKGVKVASEKDFAALRSGGCFNPCGMDLACSHYCKRKCHFDDLEHKQYVCYEVCNRKLTNCSQGHRCKKKCHSDPCDPCSIKVYRNGQLVDCCEPSTGLTPLTTELHEEEKPCLRRKLVKKILPCQHVITVTLSKAFDVARAMKENSPLAWSYCTEPCNVILMCGHVCVGKCVECRSIDGVLHKPCAESATVTLKCGHRVTAVCSDRGKSCEAICLYTCPHGKRCECRCGEPCSPCMEKCKLGCPHGSCSRLCYEPCNRQPCRMPCPLLLPCGHACLSFCGEPCPRWCRTCHANLVAKWDPKGNTRFVLLSDCNHTVRATHLDQKMLARKGEREREHLVCPLSVCGKSIVTTNRYNNYVKMFCCELAALKQKTVEKKN